MYLLLRQRYNTKDTIKKTTENLQLPYRPVSFKCVKSTPIWHGFTFQEQTESQYDRIAKFKTTLDSRQNFALQSIRNHKGNAHRCQNILVPPDRERVTKRERVSFRVSIIRLFTQGLNAR